MLVLEKKKTQPANRWLLLKAKLTKKTTQLAIDLDGDDTYASTWLAGCWPVTRIAERVLYSRRAADLLQVPVIQPMSKVQRLSSAFYEVARATLAGGPNHADTHAG